MDRETKQKQLSEMVDELLKTSPDRELVKALGQQLGIVYHEDIVAQMNAVLEFMHGTSLNEKPLKEMEN